MRYRYFYSYGDIFTTEKLVSPASVNLQEVYDKINQLPFRDFFDVYVVGGVAEGVVGTGDLDINITTNLNTDFKWLVIKQFMESIARITVKEYSLRTDIIFFEDISWVNSDLKTQPARDFVGYLGHSHQLEIVEGKVKRFLDLTQLPEHFGLRVMNFRYPSVKNIQRNYSGVKIKL
jgi:hypothetical protein